MAIGSRSWEGLKADWRLLVASGTLFCYLSWLSFNQALSGIAIPDSECDHQVRHWCGATVGSRMVSARVARDGEKGYGVCGVRTYILGSSHKASAILKTIRSLRSRPPGQHCRCRSAFLMLLRRLSDSGGRCVASWCSSGGPAGLVGTPVSN